MECVIATQVQNPSEGHVLNVRDKRDELPLSSGPIPELRLVHICPSLSPGGHLLTTRDIKKQLWISQWLLSCNRNLIQTGLSKNRNFVGLRNFKVHRVSDFRQSWSYSFPQAIRSSLLGE